ncbi:NAD(P)/FAD-dependent oxidoreductase [Burkholderia multivorans]|uniref:NAD(P)/FAD-dependent oxidoreductase n=1 Tax=Burkholderia multivorans TaxID=87883 RepID=UPI002019770C|nr:NAD(P)/FAD-dependent oxidoreductase [Burkholderia multivorans]MCA8143519.1 FAD-dependent oxidoreductase [Burkholderia multivorans]MCO1368529.1 FAD-dependent oxidoreductase [Burkholderia multivorans]MCO1380420.1 FAD-dependent oxidoreductase [Burkholderia multivorans]UQP21469.1 FAD-dependent oxidoreductase [Burkholderia multivorans]UQP92084.1 FAD-dependent oxidoreductase [Burkholderia multivorans]
MSDPVIIIGAGPAGLACAQRLAQGGRAVVIIDDNMQAGGQYFRQLPVGYKVSPHAPLLRDKPRFDALTRVLDHPNVRYLPSTTVWGSPAAMSVAYAGPAGSGRVKGAAIVIAGGAQDQPFPFTGWTLPNVISAGGALNLVKAHGLVPEGRVMVAGNGPLVLVAAATLAAAGANIVGVVEAQPSSRLASALAMSLWAAPKLLRTALSYRRRIARAGAWFRTGRMVAQASGVDAIEKVAIAPIDENGRPRRAQQAWFDVDTLVIGYGIVPSTDIARMLGCRTAFDQSLNGNAPLRSATLETSVPNVYAIGDGAGIGGVEVALLEGRIAANAILGVGVGADVEPMLARRYRHLDRFRRMLNIAYSRAKPLNAVEPETIVCRCEELTFGQLQQDASFACGDLDRLKKSSRAGMGRCQGRNCLPALAKMLDLPPEGLSTLPRARPPLKPIPLRYLAADADAGPAHEPDEAFIHSRETS